MKQWYDSTCIVVGLNSFESRNRNEKQKWRGFKSNHNMLLLYEFFNFLDVGVGYLNFSDFSIKC